MKLTRSLALALAGLVLSTGSALAAYRSDRDITLNLTLAPSLIKPSGTTGTSTYTLQEGTHQTVTESTGLEVDHYYIWVNLNGESILAVDPFWASGRNPVVD